MVHPLIDQSLPAFGDGGVLEFQQARLDRQGLVEFGGVLAELVGQLEKLLGAGWIARAVPND